MRFYFTLLLIFNSVVSALSQNLNFRDTIGLKMLLCSKAWIRYDVKKDSTFSDSIVDSIRFYPNGSFYKLSRSKADSIDIFLLHEIITGKWSLGGTGRISRTDSATNSVSLNMEFIDNNAIIIWKYVLIDGHRIKGSKFGKRMGNLDEPFISHNLNVGWHMIDIWQARRQRRKVKPRSHGF
jgi:hypothetical protein